MADQRGVVEEARGVVAVPDTVARGTIAKGDTAKNDPDALVAQIEHTRDDLARTIDALADRVSPASQVRLLREKITQQLAKPEVQAGAAVAGAVVVGALVLRMWLRQRR